jgi:hypothetical protein
MIIHHEVLEHGDFASRQQVVRWVRRFPFKFLSDRCVMWATSGTRRRGPTSTHILSSQGHKWRRPCSRMRLAVLGEGH